MTEIQPKNATFLASALVRCAQMDTNEALRKRAAKLIARGVTQKAIAAAMGMTPSTFNRWLHDEPNVKPPTVDAMDGFERFVRHLRGELDETKETQRADASAESSFLPDHPQARKTG